MHKGKQEDMSGYYIPNANISVVEKNPMNITIYNIRGGNPSNSSTAAHSKGTQGLSPKARLY